MKDGKYVVLCVDDDPGFLESVVAILEGSDFIIETRNSAADGLRAYETVQPDVMLVDLMIEEVDAGTNLVKDLRLKGVEIPILLLSSVGDELAHEIDYSELGLAGVLQKPINPSTLLSTLKAKLA